MMDAVNLTSCVYPPGPVGNQNLGVTSPTSWATPTTPQTSAGQRLGEKRQALVQASRTRYRKVLDTRESEVGSKSAIFAASARVQTRTSPRNKTDLVSRAERVRVVDPRAASGACKKYSGF
jgi:hypothetical protein